MSKKISIREFEKYCTDNALDRFEYNSKDQPEYHPSEYCEVRVIFDSILCREFTRIIFLKTDNNTLCLRGVESIEIKKGGAVYGDLITVNCLWRNVESTARKSFKLIAYHNS